MKHSDEEKRMYAATKSFEELATKYFKERYGDCATIHLSELGIINGLPHGVVTANIHAGYCSCKVEFRFPCVYSPYKVEQVYVYDRGSNIAFETVGEWIKGIEALNESEYKKFTKRRDGIAVTVYKSRDFNIDIEGNRVD